MTKKDINPSNFYSVVMGFNEYEDSERLPPLKFAEKDARDIYNVLVDEKYCNYPKENIILMTGKVGQYEIESTLFNHVVQDRDESDIVLVYYSGHGFIAGDSEDPYLATPEITIHQILNDPKAGLPMRWLHDEIFNKSRARYVIFWLDCCHSADFCPSIKDADSETRRDLIEKSFFVGEGRIAFVSSPRSISSRESMTYRNGVFTHFLLEGLKGGAADPESGEVRMSGLISYVERESISQPPLHYGQGTKIIIARPDMDEIRKRSFERSISEFAIVSKSARTLAICSLPNPIDEHIFIIDQLLNCDMDDREKEFISQKILNAVRCVVDADLVSVEQLKNYSLLSRHQSDPKFSKENLGKHRNKAINAIQSALVQPAERLAEFRFGFYKPYRSENTTKNYVVIPLRLEDPREFLLMTGVTDDKLKYGQILGRLLISLYNATGGLTTISSTLQVESTLFDDLKRWFGYVPHRIYSRRKKSFDNQLNTIRFAFEPVVDLGIKNPRIDSWEALARDPLTDKAPFDLFKAAELWGRTFIKDLDIYCLGNATREYMALWETEHAGEDKKDPLSVNVYPDSLYSPEYKAEVKRIVEKDEMLKPSELVLEISERRASPKPIDNPTNLSALELFSKELHEYTNELNISFAIDDFGLGYSSVDRLARLGLHHIKIDRDVLHHPNPEITIEYVRKMVNVLHTGGTKIIVEGYDGNHRITLAGLYDLGIRYIQGHLIRRGSLPTNLKDLSDEVKTFISNQLNKPSANEEVDERDI